MQEPDSWITVRSNPNAGKVIVVDAIFKELPSSVLMYVHTSSQTIVNITLHYSWVCSSFHFKPCNPIVVYVVAIKVSLQHTI